MVGEMLTRTGIEVHGREFPYLQYCATTSCMRLSSRITH